jgi:integrase
MSPGAIGPDRRGAEQGLALKLAEINRGTYRERKVATFHGFASEWFAGHRGHLRPSAVERMRNDLEVHLLPFFGEYLLDQIGAELIERYMSEKVAEHADGGGLSNVSINKTLTLLRQVLSAGVRYGYLDRNPVDDVRRLKVEKKSQAFLQLDQIDALLDATPEKDQPFLWTLLLSGLRIGEALALRIGEALALRCGAI